MSCNMVIVPDPRIMDYITPFNKLIPKSEVKEVNPDVENNTLASSGSMPPVYLPSTEDRGFLMYYISASSNCIPNDLAKKMYYNELEDGKEHWMPLDYMLFTRSNGTHFLLAENISDPENSRGLKSYSLLRYSNVSGSFNEDTIFSDGIDIARIRDGNQKYLDKLADELLTEKRINESLKSVDEAARTIGSDDVTHASGYVGYIDANTLQIENSLQGNLPRLFEQEVKEKSLVVSDKTPIDNIVDFFKKALYKLTQAFKSKDASTVGVIENDTTIPEDKYKSMCRENPIQEEVQLDQETGEKIELEQEQNNEVAKQYDKEEDFDKASRGAQSLNALARAVNEKKWGRVSGVPKTRDDKNKEEIDK